MVYDFPVADEKVKPHQVTSLHLICALAFIVAGLIIVVYNYTIPAWGAAILVAGLLLTALVMTRNKWVISHRINPAFRIAELLISAAIAAYSVLQQWKFPAGIFCALSAALLFALFWESTAGKQLYIHFDSEGIKLPPTARRRLRRWTEIEEVILRFGILTINCTDNSLLQWTITGTETDNKAFEAWCAAQVEENRSKRVSDW